MSEAIARTAVGYRGDPVVAELRLRVLTPALFAANMAAARWASAASAQLTALANTQADPLATCGEHVPCLKPEFAGAVRALRYVKGAKPIFERS